MIFRLRPGFVMRPEAKRVLITGAGTGIGRALAIEAARRGFAIAICGRRMEALQQTAHLAVGGVPALVVQADVTHAPDRDALVRRIADAWGELDILINNAGVVEGGAFEKASDETLERIFQTNALAPMALARAFAPLLATGSRVVNIGSIFGDIPYPGFAAYSASKFALRGFSTALRREWKRQGIEVTYVAPRATRTDAAAAFTKLIAATGMRLDRPEDVGRQIWDGIARGRNSIYARGPERLFVLMQRLFPALIDHSLSRNFLSS